MADMNMYVVIAVTVLVGVGLSLLFFGALLSIASAFGHKRMLWGAMCVLVLPLTLVYVIRYWSETAYSRQYLLPGAVLTIIAAVGFTLL